MKTLFHPIERACEIAGSQAEFARAIGVEPAFVNQMLHKRRPVPVRLCHVIEAGYGITRKELRPDDWMLIWPELADPKKEAA